MEREGVLSKGQFDEVSFIKVGVGATVKSAVACGLAASQL